MFLFVLEHVCASVYHMLHTRIEAYAMLHVTYTIHETSE